MCLDSPIFPYSCLLDWASGHLPMKKQTHRGRASNHTVCSCPTPTGDIQFQIQLVPRPYLRPTRPSSGNVRASYMIAALFNGRPLECSGMPVSLRLAVSVQDASSTGDSFLLQNQPPVISRHTGSFGKQEGSTFPVLETLPRAATFPASTGPPWSPLCSNTSLKDLRHLWFK